MNKASKKKGTAALIVLLVLILCAFIPKPIYMEFDEPMESRDLAEMFQEISMAKFFFMALGTKHSGGGTAENTVEMYLEEKNLELEFGEAFGIKTIEGTVSGAGFIHLMTHKKQYGIDYIETKFMKKIYRAVKGVL